MSACIGWEQEANSAPFARQTADTFDAAATFFDLTREWGTPEADTLQKIKFAKWNAARILKAIRQGDDPNESNPKAPEPEPEDPAEVELDAATHEISNLQPSARPVSLEEVPDAGELLPSVPHTAATATDAGGFPPTAPAATMPELPFVPSPINTPPPQAAANLHPTPPTAPPSSRPQVPPQPSPQIPTKITPEHIPLPEPLPSQPRESSTPVLPLPAASVPTPGPSSSPAYTPATNIHHKDLNQAQKHAKWAISALNFDDVPTAVKELRNALAMLGAQ